MVGRLLCACAALFLAAAPVSAQLFTYQGKLKFESASANGLFDIEYRLYDAPAAGTQIGSTLAFNSVDVQEGLISQGLDFGPTVWTGLPRYLDIRVRRSGSGDPFQPLTPLQRVNAAPYAISSLNERWNPITSSLLRTDPAITSLQVNTTSHVFSDSVLTLSRNTTAGEPLSGMYIGGTDASTISYYGWAASGLTKGEARVEGSTGDFQLLLGNFPRVNITAAGLVGLGLTPSGTARLQVSGDTTATGSSRAASFVFNAPQTRVFGIPPEAFQASASTSSGVFGLASGDAFLDAAVLGANMAAPVYLPDGATVTSFEVICKDNSAQDLSIFLQRRAYAGSAYTVLASVVSSGASAAPVTLVTNSIVQPTIDNNLYVYALSVFCADWQGSSLTIKGVRIRYTVANP